MRGAYDRDTESCPYCGKECHAEFVDNGVGLVQCSPYHCDFCGAMEIGSYDCTCDDHSAIMEEHRPGCTLHGCDPGELEIGWYKPDQSIPESP